MADVGFVGLGNMGSALARRLVGSRDLLVFDLDDHRVEELVEAGARRAESLAALAGQCSTIVTCLPTSNHVRDVLFGPNGMGTKLHAGMIVIDCTSGDPNVSRQIGERLRSSKVSFVDAPVSGGPQAADAGTIAIMVGGEKADVDRATETLLFISPNVRHTGPVGTAHTVKLLNNALAAGHRLLAFEAVAVAAANNVDPRTFIDIVNLSSGRSNATEVTMLRHVFGERLGQGFALELMAKDVGLATSLIPAGLDDLSLIKEVSRRLDETLRSAPPGEDINSMLELYELAAGVTVATSDRGAH